jgi:hypothetical protein
MGQFSKNYKLFTQKIVTKLSIIWVWDPRSGFQGSKRHRIPDPQHWCFLLLFCVSIDNFPFGYRWAQLLCFVLLFCGTAQTIFRIVTLGVFALSGQVGLGDLIITYCEKPLKLLWVRVHTYSLNTDSVCSRKR